MTAADTNAEQRSALRKLIQRRPLNGEQDRMAHREGSHADRAETNFLSMRRHRGEHDDRFQARLVNQTVAKPNRFEDAGLLRHHRCLNQFVNIGEAEQRAAIGQTDAPFHRQVTHKLVLEERSQCVKQRLERSCNRKPTRYF